MINKEEVTKLKGNIIDYRGKIVNEPNLNKKNKMKLDMMRKFVNPLIDIIDNNDILKSNLPNYMMENGEFNKIELVNFICTAQFDQFIDSHYAEILRLDFLNCYLNMQTARSKDFLVYYKGDINAHNRNFEEWSKLFEKIVNNNINWENEDTINELAQETEKIIKELNDINDNYYYGMLLDVHNVAYKYYTINMKVDSVLSKNEKEKCKKMFKDSESTLNAKKFDFWKAYEVALKLDDMVRDHLKRQLSGAKTDLVNISSNLKKPDSKVSSLIKEANKYIDNKSLVGTDIKTIDKVVALIDEIFQKYDEIAVILRDQENNRDLKTVTNTNRNLENDVTTENEIHQDIDAPDVTTENEIHQDIDVPDVTTENEINPVNARIDAGTINSEYAHNNMYNYLVQGDVNPEQERQINDLTTQNKNLEGRINDLTTENKNLKEHIKDLISENTNLKKQHEIMETALKETKEWNYNLANAGNDLDAKNISLKNELNKKDEQIDKLNKLKEKLKVANINFEKKINELKEQHNNQTESNKKTELSFGNVKILDPNKSIENLYDRLLKLQDEKSKLLNNVIDLEKKNFEQLNYIADQKEANNMLKNDVGKLESQVNLLSNVIDDMRNGDIDVFNVIMELDKDRRKLKTTIGKLQQIIKNLTNEKNWLVGKNKELTEQINSLKNENKDLKTNPVSKNGDSLRFDKSYDKSPFSRAAGYYSDPEEYGHISFVRGL